VAGATLIVEALGPRLPYAPALVMALAAAGVIFQARLRMASRK
jgi:hypothetical protein